MSSHPVWLEKAFSFLSQASSPCFLHQLEELLDFLEKRGVIHVLTLDLPSLMTGGAQSGKTQSWVDTIWRANVVQYLLDPSAMETL